MGSQVIGGNTWEFVLHCVLIVMLKINLFITITVIRLSVFPKYLLA